MITSFKLVSKTRRFARTEVDARQTPRFSQHRYLVLHFRDEKARCQYTVAGQMTIVALTRRCIER